MAKSTSPPKPAKPYPDFPLFPHATKRWAKKIKGKLHYFGPWGDPDGALARYQEQRDDLHAGRKPRKIAGEVLVRDVLNAFLAAKRKAVENGEIRPRTFGEYHATCKRIADAFGVRRPVSDLDANDFGHLRDCIAKTWGPVALGNEIQRVRVVFNFAYQAALIDAPMRYGPMFKRPAKHVLRNARNAKGKRMFDAVDLRKIIDAAPQPLKAMILLGINCGLGGADCGQLPFSAIDKGWLDFPRPKTGIQRRCKLWPETVEAIREANASRPKPKDDEHRNLVFITCRGAPFYKNRMGDPLVNDADGISTDEGKKAYWKLADSTVTKEMSKLLRNLGLHRPGLSFYGLRHTTQTIGDDAKDPVAVRHIMGHADESMSGTYREGVSDERLAAVADHVRKWLFPPKAMAAKRKAK